MISRAEKTGELSASVSGGVWFHDRSVFRDADRSYMSFACLVLLFCLVGIGVLAMSSLDSPEPDEREHSALNAPAASKPDVNHAIDLAATYLEHNCDPNGRFAYKVDITSQQQSPSYNIIRHAGAIYSLAMLNRAHKDSEALDTMVRASEFLRRNYIGPGVRPDQQVVWSKPIIQESNSQYHDAELGATGLGLVALAAVREVRPEAIPLEQLQSLGRFLLFLERGDGSFVSKYRLETGPVPNWESLYYPGEAALGLLALYQADHSPTWLNAAAKSLAYLAKSRAGLTTVPADHWALIATAELLRYCDPKTCPVSREELVRHAIQICDSILRQQRSGSTMTLDGAFDSTGRTAPAATRMEGLLAAMEFLPKGKLSTEIEAATRRGVAFLIRAQIKSGPYTGGMPGAFLPEARGGSEVRIDYVQHAMCVWLRYQKLFSHNTQQDARKKPIISVH